MKRKMNMVKRSAILTLVILAITAIPFPASGHMVPMSWGFPVISQKASLAGFQASTVSNNDLQSANIAFPMSGSAGGLFGSAFPTIGQRSCRNGFLSNLAFQSQNQDKLFAYPFISIGGSPLPGMGIR